MSQQTTMQQVIKLLSTLNYAELEALGMYLYYEKKKLEKIETDKIESILKGLES